MLTTSCRELLLVLKSYTCTQLNQFAELETRITCLAWFVAKLHDFDSSARMDDYIDVREAVNKDFKKTLENILQDSANQFQILSSALEALAPYLPETALEMSRNLNTIERRNEAFLHVITSMCEARTKTPDSIMLFRVLDGMEPGSELDCAIGEITERLCQDIESKAKPVAVFEELLSRLDRCSSSSVRAECLAELAVTVKKHHKSGELSDSIAERLLENFESVSSPREKYYTACRLISTLRATCPDLAKKIFAYLANPARATSMSESVEEGLFFLLDLLAKSAFALAKSGSLVQEDIQRICKMIDVVRDPYFKINLFSRLAFFLWRKNQSLFFSDIVNRQILPALYGLNDKNKDRTLIHRAWTIAYPAVWLEDRDKARRAVEDFPPFVRNECVFALSFSLLRKQPLGEPFDDSHMPLRMSL